MSDLTESNRQVVEQFAQLFYRERDPRAAFEKFVAPDYVQHNPGVASGRDEAIAFLEPMFTHPDSTFTVQRIVVDDEHAAIHLRAQPVGRPVLSVADFYRLHEGRIVEHWDVLQPVPDASDSLSSMF